jgi:hypothetical protein
MAESLQIIRKVLVRSLVNEKLRSILNKELSDNLKAVNADFSNFQEQREGFIAQCRQKDIKPDYDILKKMAMEEERFKNSRAQIEARIEAVAKLKDGEEYIHGTVDSMVNVGVGDNWHSVMTGVEVLLEDGLVKEIRERDVQI